MIVLFSNMFFLYCIIYLERIVYSFNQLLILYSYFIQIINDK